MRKAIQFLVLLAPLQAAASAQTPSIAQLKAMYLACNEAADRGQLGRTGIMQCSVVYEELKRRAFGGDFERMLAWSRKEAMRQKAAGAPDRVLSQE